MPRGPFRLLLALLLLASRSALSSQQPVDASKALATCLAPPPPGEPQLQPTRYADFVAGRPGRLLAYRAWTSTRPRPLNLTLFTGLTASRLNQLAAQCAHWPGPLSAAVYVPLVVPTPPAGAPAGGSARSLLLHETALFASAGPIRVPELLSAAAVAQLEKAAADIEALYERLAAAADSCALDVQLVYELLADEPGSSLADVLPINALRNAAFLAARTPLVAMVDVDLIASRTLSAFLQQPKNLANMQRVASGKSVVVIPTFQTAPQWKNLEAGVALADAVAAAPSKQALRQLVEQGLAFQFHVPHFRNGHDCTNYKKYLTSDRAYSVTGCFSASSYEPWVVASRPHVPAYSELFRGYGWNKVTHILHLTALHFGFVVPPEGFFVHRQHELSPVAESYYKEKFLGAKERKPDAVRALTDRLRLRVVKELGASAASYQPVLHPAHRACFASLPWWETAGASQQQQQQQQKA